MVEITFVNTSSADFGRNATGDFSTAIRIASLWGVLATYGISTNILILSGIMSMRKMVALTSYWLIISLSVCDLAMLLISVFHLIPASVFKSSYVRLYSMENVWALFVYDSFWYAGVLHLLVMAANRYISICRAQRLYRRLFSRGRTAALIGGAYLIGCAVALPGLHSCCWVIWDFNRYLARYATLDTPYAYVDMTINSVVILSMCFFYTKIVIKVHRSRALLRRYRSIPMSKSASSMNCQQPLNNSRKLGRQMILNDDDAGGEDDENGEMGSNASSTTPPAYGATWFYLKQAVLLTTESRELKRMIQKSVLRRAHAISKRELRLFIQFVAVSTVFLLSFVTWQWLPLLSDAHWVGCCVTALFLINNSTNPTVYLIFNRSLRDQVCRMFCRYQPLKLTRCLAVFPDSARIGTYKGQLRDQAENKKDSTDECSLPTVCNLAATALILSAGVIDQRVQLMHSCTSSKGTDLGVCSSTNNNTTNNNNNCIFKNELSLLKRNRSITAFPDNPVDIVIFVDTHSVSL